jgi:hypothetical protein
VTISFSGRGISVTAGKQLNPNIDLCKERNKTEILTAQRPVNTNLDHLDAVKYLHCSTVFVSEGGVVQALNEALARCCCVYAIVQVPEMATCR